MSWALIEKNPYIRKATNGVGMSVVEEGGSSKLRILIYRDVMQDMGWEHGNIVSVFEGSGEHEGLVAIEQSETGYTICRHSSKIGRVSILTPAAIEVERASTLPAEYHIEGGQKPGNKRLVCRIPDFTGGTPTEPASAEDAPTPEGEQRSEEEEYLIQANKRNTMQFKRSA